ncbi:hypothetical protein C5C07_13965 [Haloferax sp. Atlit-4N]|nr:hypothetical protein C5C07_13965 [Haloferax sp. Atlit-4N]
MRGINAELRAKFELKAGAISHPQQKGEAREDALRELLEAYLPERCGVSTGFVIDVNGNQSQQMDVIIYDKYYTPIFKIADSKQYFPCETVIAVGEVKSEVKSRELEDAIEKIASAKTLKRFGAPMITGPGINLQGWELSRHDHRDQIFGFIFTGDSLSKENFVTAYYDELEPLQERLWPNYYCDYSSFNVGFSTGQYYSYDPNNAKGFYLTDAVDSLFVLFYATLSAFVNEARIGRPRLLEYYGIEPGLEADLHFFPIT